MFAGAISLVVFFFLAGGMVDLSIIYFLFVGSRDRPRVQGPDPRPWIPDPGTSTLDPSSRSLEPGT